MRKRDFTSDFEDIKKMTKKIRNINESLTFGEDEDFAEDDFEEECPNGICPEEGESSEDAELERESNDPSSAVNKIREIALKGMVALCKNPEDPQYEVLKQIFNYCDKANKKKTENEQ